MKLWQKLMTSERFWAAVAALVVSIGVISWGWGEEASEKVAGEIVTAIMVFTGLFMGAKTLRETRPPSQ